MKLTEFRSNARGLPDFLPWAALIDNGIVLTKSGALMAGFAFRGPDLDSSTRDELSCVAARINAALQMTDGWSLHVDTLRCRSQYEMPDADWPDRTTRLLGEARQIAREGEAAGYDSRSVLVVTWHPDADAASKVEAIFVQGGGEAGPHLKALGIFKGALREIRDRLSGLIKISRLVDEELPDGSISSPLLAHLQACVTFEQRSKFIISENPMYLDAVLGRRPVAPGFEPIVGEKTVIALSVTGGLPATSHPGILDFLGRLQTEYRWSNRFIFLSTRQADKQIKNFRSKWAQKRLSLMNLLRSANNGNATHINLDADAMANDAVEAEAVNSSGLVRFGYWTSTILFPHEKPEVAREAARQVRKHVVDAGFDAMIEDVNAMEAYLGSMPGNTHANVRRPLIHTLNLAHYLPFTQVWSGPSVHPCPFYPAGSPPLLLAATDGATPYRLCLHAGDLGHTAIIGPTGSGKSTLLASVAAAHMRYPRAQVFAFDKGYSMQPLVFASGGQHYDIAGDDSTLAFCPLGKIDTDAERGWAAEWLESLSELNGLTITPALRKEIYRAVVQLSEQTEWQDQRTMTDYLTVVQDQDIRSALEYYTLRGAAGDLLDSKYDSLDQDRFQVFEIEHLMSRGERVVIPVLTYLFHRLAARFDGSPTLLILDEAWVMLGHPIFRAKIREWLKVLRKSNVAVVFATQSLSDLTKSGIADVVFESCPSKILLANSEAQTESIRPLYQEIGLNLRQIEIVSRMTPKRQYLHLHPDGRRVFDLGLTGEELAFLGASDRDSLRRLAQLRTEDPKAWPAAWLRERGLHAAAEQWLSY